MYGVLFGGGGRRVMLPVETEDFGIGRWARRFSSVVFPEPDGPRMARISPAARWPWVGERIGVERFGKVREREEKVNDWRGEE